MRGFVDDIRGAWGDELSGKRIIFCVTGSVAAYRSPDIVRTLIRFGADVFPVLSRGATKIIQPDVLEWASGNEVILDMSGKMEHLAPQYLSADLMIVAPATADMINKFACGIGDDVVSTMFIVALGMGIPIVVVPAMHEVMFRNPILRENILKLKEKGVHFVEPVVVEGKAKIPDAVDIVEEVINILYPKDLEGVNVVVTAGPTVEYIDAIRFITNRSSGKMGVEIARNARFRGANVTLVYGRGSAHVPSGVEVIRVETTDEMYSAVRRLLERGGVDVFISAAAVTDYGPKEPFNYKLSTDEIKEFSLELISTPKVINLVKEISPKTFLVAFKAEYGVGRDEMIERGYKRLLSSNADMIVINDVARRDIGFESEFNEVFVVDREKNVVHLEKSSKREIAKGILDIVSKKLRGE
ncbi:MAG: bifunctional phosphopantothenoylcysteine decarboxylase/phosphopantothenate--cysteine ligase CoaBC [Candidatus Njordarchaeia archaeon]